MSILKTAVDDSISGGELASFKIVVSNAGPGAATGVTISDALPSGIDWSVDDTTDCSITSGLLSCTFDTLAAGADATVIISGETVVANCGQLTNTATVAASNEALAPGRRGRHTAPRPSRSAARPSSSPRPPMT